MSYNPNLRAKPMDVPEKKPLPASNIENFNWDLWQTIQGMSDGTIFLQDKQSLITEYNEIVKLLPQDKIKRINFNPLGCVLGYRLVQFKKIDLKQHKKGSKNDKIRKLLQYLTNSQINSSNLDRSSLVRYIQYFKQKKS